MTGRTAGPGNDNGHEHRSSADTVDAVSVAEAWLAEDPDPDTRAELQALLEAGDTAGLADRFGASLEFGTAGLRGALGAGPNRMNRVVVIRAAAGLASYVKAHGGSGVVIGYDARHKSDVFARDTAEVMAGAGLRAFLLPRPLPTPVLAFAIRHLGVDAGVMVTASHNPPQDNGYKVYLGDGSQIVPPADAEISAEIAAVGPLADGPPQRRLADPRRRRGRGVPGPGHRPGRPGVPARPPDRLHAAARRRPRRRPRRLPPRRLRPAGCRGAPGRPGPGVQHRRVPQPRGARRHRPRGRRRGRAPGRHRAGQRPGRGPVRGRGPRPAEHVGLADAARRRGRRAARHPSGTPVPRPVRHLRRVHRVLVAARPDRRGARSGLRGDAHRLQVDLPGRRACATATRRRWATASTRPACGTRTASPRRCSWPSWPRR